MLFCFKQIQKLCGKSNIFGSMLYGPLKRENMQRNHILPKVILFICLITALRGTMLEVIICFQKKQHDFLNVFII